MPQVHQQIADRVIDGDCDGEVVNIYDTDSGAVVVVRWDEDRTSGFASALMTRIARISRPRISIRAARNAGA
jgi:hypothetical protein